MAEDTTQFDFSTHHAALGLGPTGAAGLQGFFMHSALAMTVEGIPLGLLGCQTWKRTDEPRPDRAKESRRWPEMLAASTVGIRSETRVVHICDREADFFEFLSVAQEEGHLVLVRAYRDRKLSGEGGRLWETVEATEPLGQMAIPIPRSDEHPERIGQFSLRAVPVSIPAPAHLHAEHLPPVDVVAVLAQEIDAPAGEDPVCWMLFTTLPISTFGHAAQCLRWYALRWRIERFHYTLKSGCRIEKLQLETAARIRTALAVYCLVAWRLLFLIYAAREQPEQPCTIFLTQPEWQALYARTHRAREVPADPPDVRTAVRWIAKLGGFLGRKSDGEPGVKVLWRGFRRLTDIAEDWLLFRTDT